MKDLERLSNGILYGNTHSSVLYCLVISYPLLSCPSSDLVFFNSFKITCIIIISHWPLTAFQVSPPSIFILVYTYPRDGVLDDCFISSFSQSLVLFVKRVSTARRLSPLYSSLNFLLRSHSISLCLSITSCIYESLFAFFVSCPFLPSFIAPSFTLHTSDSHSLSF